MIFFIYISSIKNVFITKYIQKTGNKNNEKLSFKIKIIFISIINDKNLINLSHKN